MEFQLIPFVLTKVFPTSNSMRGSRRMPRMLISLLGYKDPRLSEIIRNAYHCAPSQGMTGEELHNFCKFLYSQIQSKDEEISCLIANIKELTYEVRLSRLQQQTYNDENKALSATHSQKLDVVLQQLQETKQELTDTKRKLETAETLLADANKKNSQLEAERKKNAKERKDMEDEIVLLRSDLYSGTKSLQ